MSRNLSSRPTFLMNTSLNNSEWKHAQKIHQNRVPFSTPKVLWWPPLGLVFLMLPRVGSSMCMWLSHRALTKFSKHLNGCIICKYTNRRKWKLVS